MPLEMVLTYRGINPQEGPLGPRWTHSYAITLHENSDGTIVMIGGSQRRFYFADGGTGYHTYGDGSTLLHNADGTWTVSLISGLKFHFDSGKKLTAIVDRYNNAIQIGTAPTGETTVTDPYQRVIKIHYNGDKIDWIQDPAGKQYVLSYRLGSPEMLESVTGPPPDPTKAGEFPSWRFNYQIFDLEYVTDPEGHISKYEYHGNLSRTVDPEGVVNTSGDETADADQHSKSWSYGFARGTMEAGATTITEKDGGQWVYRYGGDLRLLLSKEAPNGKKLEYAYFEDPNSNAYGKIKTITVPIINLTRYVTEFVSYHATGRPTEIKGFQRDLTYDENDKLVLKGDQPADTHFIYDYDDYGRIELISDQITNTRTTVDYVTAAGVETVTITAPKINSSDASGPQTKLVFRNDGQLDQVIDPLGRTFNFGYSATGLLESATDNAEGLVASFGDLDKMGRPRIVTVTAGGQSRVSHVV